VGLGRKERLEYLILDQVINRIRAMMKRDLETKVLLDLNNLVDEVLVFARGEILDHKIVLRTELDGNLPMVFVDRILPTPGKDRRFAPSIVRVCKAL
jgi:hypothetical protein